MTSENDVISDFFQKINFSEPIFVKIGTIVHFDNTSSQKKIQNDSDIFDVVMTSSFLQITSYPTIYENRFGRSVFSEKIGYDIIPQRNDDVITPLKMSVSI